ncbi:unnamed protein product, partial [Aureobasidium vineae]
PILTRDHREEFSKRSPTVAIRYDEPRAAYQATLCLRRAGTHTTKRSACTCEAESARRLVFTPVVRFRLESPRATISSSYNQWFFCLRCEDMLEKVNLPRVSVGQSDSLFITLIFLPQDIRTVCRWTSRRLSTSTR